MRRLARWTLLAIAGLAVSAIAVVGVVAGSVWLLGRVLCRADELASVPSPDGRMRAVILQHDGGATGRSGREVAILGAHERVACGTGPVLGFGEHEQPDPNAPWVGP